MTKKLKWTWEAIYPIMIYMVIISLAMQLIKDYTTISRYSKMLAQGISKAICIPAMWYFYSRGPKGGGNAKHPVVGLIVSIVSGVLLSIALNDLIDVLPIKAWSVEFQKVNVAIYSDQRIFQIFSAVICAPILEEVLFRGIVCSNLRAAYGKWIGVLGSSLLFGALHFNLVQFVYATLLGIIFGCIYEETKSIWNCIFAHMAANMFSLCASWYGWNHYLAGSTQRCLVVGILSLVIGLVLLRSLHRQ